MQIRYSVNVSASEYNKQKLCEKAELNQCPIHPEGGCGIRRHGTYARKWPIKLKIPCWYCRAAHTLISLLPDFLPSRLSGTLKQVEKVVLEAQKYPSLESAAENIRPNIELPGAVRWLRRRIKYVTQILTRGAGILPQFGFKNLKQLQKTFKIDFVLPYLREILETHLHKLPHIIGLIPPHLETVNN